jgi:hypothetical protein
MSLLLLSLSFWEKSALQQLKPGSKIFLVVPVEMIRTHQVAPCVAFFHFLRSDPVRFQAAVMWTFDGYENDSLELSDIPEVRRFVRSVVEQCPEVLFFMNRAPITGTPDFEHLFMLMLGGDPFLKAGETMLYAVDLEAAQQFFNQSLVAIRAMLAACQISPATISGMEEMFRHRFNESFRKV